MAIYNLTVSTIKRSAGRSATAAAAYRSGAVIACEKWGKTHDYSRKGGVEFTRIVAPEAAPEWCGDRAALWNAAEAKETRKNSVVAREWFIALPHELDAGARIEAATEFAQSLVERYGVAADIAIHAPGREGDARNHHAHILTTTRRFDPEGLAEKTRALDAAKTGGPEIEIMREAWAGIANRALERAGRSERVDHRSLEAQRAEAETEAQEASARGDEEQARQQQARADLLNRAPEPKMGPAHTALERRAQREAAAEGRAYEPVTARGAELAETRALRQTMQRLQERIEERITAVRSAYEDARESGESRTNAARAGLAALLDRERARAAARFTEPRAAYEDEEQQRREAAEQTERQRQRQQEEEDHPTRRLIAYAETHEVFHAERREEAADRLARMYDDANKGEENQRQAEERLQHHLWMRPTGVRALFKHGAWAAERDRLEQKTDMVRLVAQSAKAMYDYHAPQEEATQRKAMAGQADMQLVKAHATDPALHACIDASGGVDTQKLQAAISEIRERERAEENRRKEQERAEERRRIIERSKRLDRDQDRDRDW